MSGSSDTAESQRGGTEAPGASEPGPPVSLSARLLADLRRVLGEDAVLTEPARLLPYESDGMPLYRGYPAAVLLPRDTESVTAAIRLLHAAAVPWVARGAGTGLSGGATAPAAGVIIGLARLREALEIDTRARRARVEAGVINLELNREVKPFGLMFAPDPSSEMACTIGGNVATNAGGPHTLKYGVTSQHLLGARVILGDGTPLELGGAEETMAGYDLVGLLCGSEGTFGLVTEATVRLSPLPEATRTFLVAFERVADASQAVTALLLEGILPAALEMIDSVVLDALEEAFGAGFPLDAGALLIGEVDGLEDSVDVQLEAVARVFKAAGGRELRLARTAAESAALWMARKKTFGALGRVSPNYLSHDAVIPRTALPAVLQRISEVARKWDLRIANVFHAGDGNLHPAVLFDEADPELLRRAQAAGREILHVCIAAGGVITGEHGIGVSKRESMRWVFTDAEIRLMDQLRHIFDPWNEVNPGKVLPRIPRQDPDDPAGASTVGECDPSEAQADRKAEDHEIEISEALHRAWVERKLLAPVGAGTLMVAPPTGETLPTGGMERIVRYDPGDMAVTVDPGVRLAVLEEQLAREGQRLAWEAPDPESATIGGIVAAGYWSSKTLALGHPKHSLLGFRAITGTGELIGFGGRVVKNVSGYDLARLLVGSHGTLAVFTQLILRTYPLPEQPVMAVIEGTFTDLLRISDRLLERPVGWSLCDLLVESAACRLVVGLDGTRQEITRRRREVETVVSETTREGGRRAGSTEIRLVEGREATGLRRRCADWLGCSRSPLRIRIVFSPACATSIAARVHELCEMGISREAGNARWDCRMQCHPGIGLIRLGFAESFDRAALRRLFLALADEVRAVRGYRALDRAPEALWWGWDPWGAPRELSERMRRIKLAFDPRGVLAPWMMEGWMRGV